MEFFDNGASLVSKRTFPPVLKMHTDTGMVTWGRKR